VEKVQVVFFANGTEDGKTLEKYQTKFCRWFLVELLVLIRANHSVNRFPSGRM